MAVFNNVRRKDYMREYRREWQRRKRAKDPEYRLSISLQTRGWQQRHPIRAAKLAYVGRASRSGRLFALSDVRFVELVSGKCAYCGSSPNPVNGIDRVDSNLGYVEGNVVTACGPCNRAKRNMSLDEFKTWIVTVFNHMNAAEKKYGGI